MEFIIPGCKPDPPLRVSSKTVHLTWAALYPGELMLGRVLAEARGWGSTRGGLLEYAIGREKHPAPADPQRDEHFHAYFKFGKKVELADRNHTIVFDLRGRNGRVLHPELQAVKNNAADRQRVINYDIKDGDYAAELATPLVYDRRRDIRNDESDEDSESDDEEGPASKPPPTWASMLNKCNTVREGMELLAEKAPQIYYMHGERVEANLMKRIGTPTPKLFTLADFNRPALALDLPTVLYGKTETGKSAFAKAHFENPLIVRRRDDLKRVNGATDGIIFDDCNFCDWSAEDTICHARRRRRSRKRAAIAEKRNSAGLP